jgi:hypothetical protein
MPTFLRNFTKNSQIAVLQAKNAKITTQNLNEDKDGSLNKSMPSRKKSRSTSGSAWTAFSRGFICPFFVQFCFYGVRLFGERSEPTRILQAHAVVPLTIFCLFFQGGKKFLIAYKY